MKDSMHNRRVGLIGEDAAVKYLEGAEYRIAVRNYRTCEGEIDIIAREGDVLVVVEVKARTGDRFGRPCEAVDRRKRGRIRRTAAHFLTEGGEDVPTDICDGYEDIRFDVIEVVVDASEAVVGLVHLKCCY